LPVGDILLQAHRGGDFEGKPENSIALFQKAIESGIVDRIETDIHITSDNVLVIMHDQAVPARCAPLAGTPIHQLTWEQLKTVRCGQVVAPATPAEGEPIPALTEVFDLIRDTAMDLNLELKSYTGITTAGKTDLARRVVQAVLASGLPAGKVMLSSYYWRDYAGVVKAQGPGIFFSAIEFTASAQPYDKVFSTIRKAKALGVDAFAGPIKYSNEGLLAFIRDYGGMYVGLMDAEGTSDLRFAIAHGLRNVTNDNPVATQASLKTLLDGITATPLTLKVTSTPVPTKTVLNKTLKKNGKSYPQVIGKTGPLAVTAARQLHAVTFSVTVIGKAKGTIELAPSGSRVGVDGVRVKFPKGKKTTFTLTTVPGDGGDVRVRVTGKAKVVVKVTGYQRADY
jgi:glycerophosphoryl diester phosphodiesterase